MPCLASSKGCEAIWESGSRPIPCNPHPHADSSRDCPPSSGSSATGPPGNLHQAVSGSGYCQEALSQMLRGCPELDTGVLVGGMGRS